MKLFDVNAWKYGTETGSLRPLADILARSNPKAAEKLSEVFDLFSGKEISLFLCGMLEGRYPSLRVPAWFTANQEREEKPRFNEAALETWRRQHYDDAYIVRSSHRNEDWRDARSGVHASETCTWHGLTEKVRSACERGEEVVVQHYVWGIGCVIDVGYSELLERPIVRIARGNKSLEGGGVRWTSATWDHEAVISVYDAETCELVAGGDEPRMVEVFTRLAKEVVSALQGIGITFGVQLEVIVNDRNLKEWNLVQVRPSPEHVRGHLESPSPTGALLATTPAVNTVGVCEGEIVHIGDPFRAKDSLTSDLYREYPVSPEAFKNKIVLWDYAFLKHQRYQPLESIRTAIAGGAVGHLTQANLFVNSAHGGYLPYHRDGLHEKWENARSQGVQLGHVDRMVIRELEQKLRAGPVRLRLVSDGLIGRVYAL